MNKALLSPDIGFNVAGFEFGDSSYNVFAEEARRQKAMFMKSLTTGEGIVASGATGGQALRLQFMHGMLEKQSFEQDDAMAMKVIPKKDVTSTAIEWTTQGQYGGPGDGFVPETGSDGNFGLSGSDTNYKRRVRNVKFLAAKRLISLAAQLVRNVTEPEATEEESATLEIIGKANLAVYFGDSYKSNTQFDGLIRQITDWVTEFPQDQVILWDAQGQPIDADLLEKIAVACRTRFGRPSMMLMSALAYGDTQSLLFPRERYGGGALGEFGVDKRTFRATTGPVKLVDDPTLRPNQPLVVDGTGMDGKPRTGAGDTGSVGWNANPWSACSAGAAGSGNFWQNVTTNDLAAAISAPRTPSGEGNQKNALAAGTYYYAASVVYQGLESLAWVFGAAAADTVTGATAVTVTAGQIVTCTFDYTKITGLGSTYPRNRVKVRVYRYGGPGAAAPTALSDFDFLFEVGWPTGGTANTSGFDNGFNIPGTDNAFLITEKKGRADGWFWAQLLPMMRRPLPHLEMGDPVAMLCFGCPILWVPRHHIHVRNVGRAA